MPHNNHRNHHDHRKSSSSDSTDGAVESPPESLYMQTNESTLLGVDANFLKHPRKHGRIFNVSYARNYNGGDNGEICAVKWKRPDHRCDTRGHYKTAIRISEIAVSLVEHFMAEIDTKGWQIIVNKPKVWKCQDRDGSTRCVLVEPCIRNFRRFNSNSGWVGEKDRTHSKVMQALSHYSYVRSEGKLLLCDLQGGVSRDGDMKIIYLTDPAITSLKRGAFGCTDNGSKYLLNFFKHHVCSDMCKQLPRPKDNKVFFTPMVDTVVSGDSNF